MKIGIKILAVVMVMTLILCGCGDVSGVKIDYGKSSIYTREDMDAAIEKIKNEFRIWDGCTLYTIDYVGDKRSMDNLDYVNDLDEDANFTQCMVFESSFHTPADGGSGFNPDDTYTGWSWYLARSADGEWKLLTWGY